MNRKRILLLAIITFVISVASFPYESHKLLTDIFSNGVRVALADDSVSQNSPPGPPPNLLVKKISSTWKVVWESDSTKSTITAKRGQVVRWKAVDSDVYFQFPKGHIFAATADSAMARNPDKAANLAAVYTRKLKANHSLTLIVRADADTGNYAYAAFCVADSAYAIGKSPPEIIIEP